MPRMLQLTAVALLLQAPARAGDGAASSGLHAAVSLGLGLSQDVAGLGVELRDGHFGAAIGAGLPMALGCGSASGSLRYFASERDGWFFGLNGGLVCERNLLGYVHFDLWAVSVTAVRRWNFDPVFLQVGGGPALWAGKAPLVAPVFLPLVDIQAAIGLEF